MTRTARWLVALVLTTFTIGACSSGTAAPTQYTDQGISDTEVKIGFSGALTGGLAATQSYGQAIKAYFKMLNATQGGVQFGDGKKRLVTVTLYDDAYDPAKTTENYRRANEEDKVFAMSGSGVVQNAARDYSTRNKLPQVFVGSADPAFNNLSAYPYANAWWPSVGDDAYIDVQYALSKNPSAKIGSLALNNDFGKAVVESIKAALGTSKQNQYVLAVNYDSNNADVSSQIQQLKNAGVDVLISNLAGAQGVSGPKYMTQIGWKPTVFMINNSRGSYINPGGPDNFKGYYSTLYVKDPADPAWTKDAAVTKFAEVITKYAEAAKPDDLFAMQGYSAGEAWQKVFEMMKQPTRAAMLDAINHGFKNVVLDVLYPGVTLNSGPGGRLIYARQQVQFDGTQWQAVGTIVNGLDLPINKK